MPRSAKSDGRAFPGKLGGPRQGGTRAEGAAPETLLPVPRGWRFGGSRICARRPSYGVSGDSWVSAGISGVHGDPGVERMEVARRGPRSGRGGRSRPRQPAYLSWPPPCPRSQPSSGTSAPPAAPTERSMRAPGRPLLLGLLLVLSAAGPGRGFAQPREAAETQTLLRLIAEVVQELKKFHAGESKRLQLLGPQQDPLRGGAGAAGAEEQRAEIVPRDLRMKDKFLKHLTGPLYFSAKCSKHFHRLYHNTRDCTIPAYYKRCARLLTRLAVSPLCMEG